MRRHTLLLAAGSSAYFVGASVNAHLRHPELCDESGCRSVAVANQPRAMLIHPFKAIRFLVAPVCND